MSARKPTTAAKPRKPTAKRMESILQRNIEIAIGSEPDFLLLRNSVGRAQHINETTGKTFYVPYGLGVGSPDLVGVLAPWGTFIGMEVKDPNGVVEPHQATSHELWRRFGAIVFVVRSVDEAKQVLQHARRECWMRTTKMLDVPMPRISTPMKAT